MRLPSLGHGAEAARSERWRLDTRSFDALLAALDSDRDTAAERYAALRERLSRFFAWNRIDDPDTHADETLDRVARRIIASARDDEAVRDPERFAAGVARLLLREEWRRQKSAETAIASLQQERSEEHRRTAERQHAERLSALLEECLQALPDEQRDLIRRYYCSEAREQIDTRKRLADELQISLNALRNRALRIRSEVERNARLRLEREAT